MLELITILGLKFIISSTIYTDCDATKEEGQTLYGCVINKKDIYLNADNLRDSTVYHEIAHAFLDDKETRRVIASYPLLYNYEELGYKDKNDILDESISDYYAEYKTNAKFGDGYPVLDWYFRERENKLVR